MSLKAKLFISFSASLVLVAGLCFFFLGHRDGRGALRSERAPGADPEAPSSAPAEERAVEGGPVEPGETSPVDARDEESAAVAGADPSAPGWLILGRMVREDASGILQPAAGVTVLVRGHPRKTRPEDAPPPREVVTGPDGRFEFPGVPPRIALRLEVDEPSSAYRALSFRLGSTEGDDRKDLGDVPLDPGSTLQVELLGPNDEPVEKATVLVEKSSSNHSPLLANLGFSDSRREAEELGKGRYILERSPPGSLNIDIQAPRCASTREKVELPRADPFIIRLAAGHRIAGRVFSAGTAASAEKSPHRKAEVEVTSGPNLFDPRPKNKTDGSGLFTFDSLSEGSFEVVASADGYASERKRDVPSGTEDL
ncbi:MAG TPA: carboxypeptidase-like regulatory domain-containing protein, partial [Planctomycetota bacterium]|nr:carboxypeptidase-like regulatory domain-containing protein [Planctomycetota bacterium]